MRALSGSSSTLLADLAHPNVHVNGLLAPGRRTLDDNDSTLRSAVADPAAWFAGHGWHARAIDPLKLPACYSRPMPPALDPTAPDGPLFWLTEAWT